MILVVTLAAGGRLFAQFNWTGNSTNNGAVTDSQNWGGSAPTGSGTENLTFGTSGAQTNVLVPTTAFNNLTFGAGRPAYTFSGTGGTPLLTLNGNITVGAGSNVLFDNSLNLNLASGFDHVVDVAASTFVQINGVISGGGHLSKTGAGTLTLTGANTYNYIGDLTFVNSTVVHAGTLQVIGGTINHSTTGDLFVGENNGDSGTLLLSGGGTISGYFGVLGQSGGSAGTATVTGGGSTWTTSSGMGVGFAGNGTLYVLSGGTVVTPVGPNNADSYIAYGGGSISAATVNGTGSSWTTAAPLDVGYFGQGTLTITSGGTVTDENGLLGVVSSGVGTVTVDGPGSSWFNGSNIFVGSAGTGTLAISNAGSVSSQYTYIAAQTGGIGSTTVTGAGSTLTNSAYTFVGNSGAGTLGITGGGSVIDASGGLGWNPGSSGTATVDGAGSTWLNPASLFVGFKGTGLLTLSNGGAVSTGTLFVGGGYSGSPGTGTVNITSGGALVSNDGLLGNDAGATGTITVNGPGSLWAVSGDIELGDFAGGTGNLSITNGGAVVSASTSSIGTNGAAGAVTISGAGSSWTSGGNLGVGAGAGGLGTLLIANGGLLNVGSGGGLITLGATGATGTLNIGAAAASAPAAGGIVNTAAITTDTGTGTVQFNTTATSGTPFYLTGNGTAGGPAVVVTGPTSLINTAGYNVLTGTNTYTGGTTINGGTLAVNGGSIIQPAVTLNVGLYPGDNGTLALSNSGTISVASSFVGGAAGSTGTVVVDGADSRLDSPNFYVGSSGSGTLNISNGGVVNSLGAVYITTLSGSVGAVTVDGAGSMFNTSFFRTGPGAATLTITNGGTVVSNGFASSTASTSTSVLMLDGVGSTWTDTSSLFTLGRVSSISSLTIAHGGLLNVGSGGGLITLGATGATGTLNIGAAAASAAAAGGIVNAGSITTDTGTGTLQFNTTATSGTPYYLTKDGTAGGAAVGVTGPTSLINTAGYNVLTGAYTYSGGTTINGGTLAVNGGSIIQPTAYFNIGYNPGDNGTLAISNGGTVTSFNSFIGYNPGSFGAVTVDGTGSSLTATNALIVGENGASLLAISNGGKVYANSDTIIGSQTGSSGTVTVDGTGSAWNINGTLYVGILGTGALTLSNGGVVNVGSIGRVFVGYATAGSTLNIGAPMAGPAATGGVLNASFITTSGGTGTIQFNTTAPVGNRYYFTNDGTAGGTALPISGAIQVINTAGYTVLTGANTYTGGTSIGGGYLLLGDYGTTGSITGGVTFTGNVNPGGGELQFLHTDAYSFAGNISGPGRLSNFGTGTTTLGGVNTYSGETFVSAGALADGGAGTFSPNSIMRVNTGASLLVNYNETIAGLDDFTTGVSGPVNFGATPSALTINLAGANTFSGVISGAGSLVKTGTGTENLAGANTYAGGTTVNFGTLQVGAGGSISHPSASLTVGDVNGNVGTVAITNGGTLAGQAGFIGNAAGSTGTVVVDGTGSRWDAGFLNVGYSGSGTLDITNGGVVNTSGSAWIAANAGGAGAVTVDGAGSTLNASLFRIAYGPSTLTITHGGTVNSTGFAGGSSAAVNGTIMIDGVGSNFTDSGGLFQFVRLGAIIELTVANEGALNSAGGTGTILMGSGSGTLNIGADAAAAAAAGGIVNAATINTTGTGTLQFNTTATSGSPYYLTNNGTAGGTAVVVAGLTQLTNTAGYNVLTGTNTYTGGTLVNGGTIAAASNAALGTGSVTLNGGTLNVASGVTLANPLVFSSGGTLGGTGTIATNVTVGTGIQLSPGNSPGTLSFTSGLTLAPGGSLDFEVQSAAGPPGTGYDLLSISGAALDISATSGSPFTLKLISLNAGGTAGAVADFSAASPYTWIFASSAAGITNFAANKFVIDISSFSNSLTGGTFAFAQSGNNLTLNFTPVPEPSTWALLASGLGLSGFAAWRKRRRI